MRAKYNYRVAVQDARVVRCSKLKEGEATYSEALHKNTNHEIPSLCNTSQGTCKVHE